MSHDLINLKPDFYFVAQLFDNLPMSQFSPKKQFTDYFKPHQELNKAEKNPQSFKS